MLFSTMLFPMSDVQRHKTATVLAALIALVGVGGHVALAQKLPSALDEWFILFAIASLTILTTMLKRERSWIEREPANPPVWQHARAEALVEVDRRLVPVQHGPLDPA
jgi:hypothetical protein